MHGDKTGAQGQDLIPVSQQRYQADHHQKYHPGQIDLQSVAGHDQQHQQT